MAVRRQNRLILGCAAVLLMVAAKPMLAISPSVVLVYGGNLAAPIVLRPSGPADFPILQMLWWRAGRFDVSHTLRGNPLVAKLDGRPYLNLAIFWGARTDPDPLKPEDASQHGRLYLPAASQPPVVVVTAPNMVDPLTGGRPAAVSIPENLDGFIAAWTLGSPEMATLGGWGIPGF